jgi:uncharacterized protein
MDFRIFYSGTMTAATGLSRPSGGRPWRVFENARQEDQVTNSSVPAKAIVEESTSRGYLAKQLYVVFTRPTSGISPVMENLAAHLAFQEKLEADGIMFAAGPNWADDEQAWEGNGMVVIRARSLGEATEIASRDPMHISGARTFQVRPWFVNEGTLTVQLGFATGRFKLV